MSSPLMKTPIGIAIIFSAIMSGCSKGPQEWGTFTANPDTWFYLAAREARLEKSTGDAEIRDEELILTDTQVVVYNNLDTATNHRVLVAMPINFRTMLVTGAVGQAAIPELRGKVLPTVVDKKIEIHFLSYTNNKWYSTNVIRTRVVSLTVSP